MLQNKLSFFFCPASDYLNQYNETGSLGQISYQFIRHLAKKKDVSSIDAVVFKSLRVDPIKKASITVLFKNNEGGDLKAYDSLFFYLRSYLQYKNSPAYKKAQVVQHLLPFAYGFSFNLFFIFRDRQKKYIIGPILAPHVDAKISADEQYVFKKTQRLSDRMRKSAFIWLKTFFVLLFGGILRSLSDMTLKHADTLIFSDNYSLSCHKRFITQKQKVLVLDTGIDTTIFKPTRIKQKRDKGVLNVLFVGRLTKRKGCEYLIKAIAQVRKAKINSNIQCVIAGDGPLQSDLEKLSTNLGLENSIKFLGNVPNEMTVEQYHATDIVCLPALSDTFTVVKEAMSCGKPVIITDVASHKERVRNGVDGFVVPPENAQAIAKALLKLLEKPNLLNTLSANAQKTHALYNWDFLLEKYLKHIK